MNLAQTLTLHAAKEIIRLLNASTGRDLPEDCPERYVQEHPQGKTPFLEFLAEHSNHESHQLLATCARQTACPLVDAEILPAPAETVRIAGLPLIVLNRTPFGTATLLSSLPSLDGALKTHRINELTLHESIARYLSVITVSYVLCEPKQLAQLIHQLAANKRLNTVSVEQLQELRPIYPFADVIDALNALALTSSPIELPTDHWQADTISELKTRLNAKRIAPEHPHRTAWYALTSAAPYVSLENTPAQEKLSLLFAPTVQRRFDMAPICAADNSITLAAGIVPNVQTRHDLQSHFQHKFKPSFVLANPEHIQTLINKALSAQINIRTIAEEIQHEPSAQDFDTEQIDVEELLRSGKDDERTVIQLLNGILVQAIQDRATDVHISSAPQSLCVRFRIDGTLIPYPHHLPRGLDRPLITRIKIISDINTQRTGLPEDGKFSTKISGREYDIRVTTCPTIHGEKAILRIQPKNVDIPTLESLGFQGTEKQVIIRSIEADHGLLIICGPTGSGKTTTLYAAIGLIDRLKYNIVTGEAPVEIRIPHVEQTQIRGQLTFGKFVTASLRQDPDYILIGETRDTETAQELIRAAITGHNVMTTLHTNNAASAPSRLIDLGVQPFLLADALAGVCAQRLLKRLCPNCLEQAPWPPSHKLREMGIREDWLLGKPTMPVPVGCRMCRGTGYSGLIAIIEGYLATPDIRDVISKENADPRKIQALMEAQSSKSLFQHAIENVAKGICSLTQALSIQQIS